MRLLKGPLIVFLHLRCETQVAIVSCPSTCRDNAGLRRAQTVESFDVLDAGCGTGLCGAVVASFARRLVGVDISQGMLDHAKSKNIYHKLVQAELTEFLRESNETFDLIVSSDTLVYFGDLSGVLGAFAKALRPQGLLVFTLERAVGEGNPDYQLQLHGRYNHSQAYVEQLLESLGLHSTVMHAELRMEAGLPVSGLLVRASPL